MGIKEILIICLVGIICLLLGILITKNSSSEAIVYQQPADDGKLAKTYKESSVIAKIKEKAKDLQACYFTYLESSPEVKEGVVKILFKVEENGFVDKVQITHSDLKNSKLNDCILNKFERTYFAPPPLGINRFISHDLDFMLEETAIREAKERELRNQPPKVLPVN